MGYTKGGWEVDDCLIMSDNTCIARVFKTYFPCEAQKTNAHLIAAAVNACISVNPDNPTAVALSINDMYEALKGIIQRRRNECHETEAAYIPPEIDAAYKALTKAAEK